MSMFNKGIFLSFLFIIGLWSFVSGQFVGATLAFAAAAILSNIMFSNKASD